MMLLNMFFGTSVEILDKIGQNIDSRFAGREWGYILVLDMGRC
jgi:hypothetical protein